jgi:hypothetical protein
MALMKCIYEIRYEVQWDHSDPGHWEQLAIKVCSGLDAAEAISMAKDAALAKSWLDDNGVEHHCVTFRLREVLLVAESEL